MLIAGVIASWLIGSVGLYAFLVRTAKEPNHEECVDCKLMDCAMCPLLEQAQPELRRAA